MIKLQINQFEISQERYPGPKPNYKVIKRFTFPIFCFNFYLYDRQRLSSITILVNDRVNSQLQSIVSIISMIVSALTLRSLYNDWVYSHLSSNFRSSISIYQTYLPTCLLSNISDPVWYYVGISTKPWWLIHIQSVLSDWFKKKQDKTIDWSLKITSLSLLVYFGAPNKNSRYWLKTN